MFSCALDMEAKARHSFVGEENNELSMTRGQKLRVLVHGSSWSLIVIGEEEGWAPTNYLELKKNPCLCRENDRPKHHTKAEGTARGIICDIAKWRKI